MRLLSWTRALELLLHQRAPITFHSSSSVAGGPPRPRNSQRLGSGIEIEPPFLRWQLPFACNPLSQASWTPLILPNLDVATQYVPLLLRGSPLLCWTVALLDVQPAGSLLVDV
ncbi:hypothetical protein LR48_Vigan431s000500 [Vigna angularis]|uniref:Uncharacterized protein n=2 Tax=Phaseolus angularis TaxID=3914 RepID=A0A0L9TAU1_PHAAN|nr:hypothetical protein LR48_Vigan431s000500 [Vigna angularis]BAT88679.1 hypothetical protein VIGAN_05225100 [Vigna angularis var. angularis]